MIDIEGFFIEDEKKFRQEDIARLISKLKPYAKLVGKRGRVHVEDKSLSDTNKSKLFLITRYLGAELAKLKPGLGIDKNIVSILNKDLEKFLSVSAPNARSRVSQLVGEGFARRTERGNIQVEPFQIERFLDKLETKKAKTSERPKRAFKPTFPKAPAKETVEIATINENEVFNNLLRFLKVDKHKLQDVLFMRGREKFKFNDMVGDSKTEKQRNCILCVGYIYYFGYQKKTFSSREIKDICFHSGIDPEHLRFTIRDMKKKNLISKAGRQSQDNILREEGKQEAEKILKELCR